MEAWREELYLQHHGIKGMHWGIRRFQPYPKGHKGGKEIGEAVRASLSARRNAKKDAKEYIRADKAYGKGAGNRRRQIKETVEERSNDPVYKKTFDKQLKKQDPAYKRKVLGTVMAIYSTASLIGADRIVKAYTKKKVSDLMTDASAILRGKKRASEWVFDTTYREL